MIKIINFHSSWRFIRYSYVFVQEFSFSIFPLFTLITISIRLFLIPPRSNLFLKLKFTCFPKYFKTKKEVANVFDALSFRKSFSTVANVSSTIVRMRNLTRICPKWSAVRTMSLTIVDETSAAVENDAIAFRKLRVTSSYSRESLQKPKCFSISNANKVLMY